MRRVYSSEKPGLLCWCSFFVRRTNCLQRERDFALDHAEVIACAGERQVVSWCCSVEVLYRLLHCWYLGTWPSEPVAHSWYCMKYTIFTDSLRRHVFACQTKGKTRYAALKDTPASSAIMRTWTRSVSQWFTFFSWLYRKRRNNFQCRKNTESQSKISVFFLTCQQWRGREQLCCWRQGSLSWTEHEQLSCCYSCIHLRHRGHVAPAPH